VFKLGGVTASRPAARSIPARHVQQLRKAAGGFQSQGNAAVAKDWAEFWNAQADHEKAKGTAAMPSLFCFDRR